MSELDALIPEAQHEPAAQDSGVTATAINDGQTGGDVPVQSSAGDTGETKSQREIELEQKVSRLTKLLGTVPARPEPVAAEPAKPAEIPAADDYEPYVGRIEKAFDNVDRKQGIKELLTVVSELSGKNATTIAQQREAERQQQEAVKTAASQLRTDWNTANPELAGVSDNLLRAALTEAWDSLPEIKFADKHTKADTLKVFEEGKRILESWGYGKPRAASTAQVGTTVATEPIARAPVRGAVVSRQPGDVPEKEAFDALLTMGDAMRPKRGQ